MTHYEIYITIFFAALVGMGAKADDDASWKWVSITAGLCMISTLLPLPYLRIVVAGVLAFFLLVFVQVIRSFKPVIEDPNLIRQRRKPRNIRAHIRRDTQADHAGIHAVHKAAFPTTEEAILVDRLRNAGRLHLSLVAEQDGQVVGHIALSPVNLYRGLGLGPLAVLPQYQRQGIGEALVQRAIDLCREDGAGFIVVLGDPEYYERFGFLPAARFGLRDTYAGGDAFQILVLRGVTLPENGGLVLYAPEFDEMGHPEEAPPNAERG